MIRGNLFRLIQSPTRFLLIVCLISLCFSFGSGCFLHTPYKGTGKGFGWGKGFGLANIEYASSKEEERILGGLSLFSLAGGGAENREGFLSLPYDSSSLLPLLESSYDGDSLFLEVEQGGVLKGEGSAFDGAEASELVG